MMLYIMIKSFPLCPPALVMGQKISITATQALNILVYRAGFNRFISFSFPIAPIRPCLNISGSKQHFHSETYCTGHKMTLKVY